MVIRSLLISILLTSAIWFSVIGQDSTNVEYTGICRKIYRDNILKRRRSMINRNKITDYELINYYRQTVNDTTIISLTVFTDSLTNRGIEIIRTEP